MYKTPLVLLLFITGMAACKKDSTQASIEGKWEMTAFTPAPADIVLDWQPVNSQVIIELRNGTYSTNTGSPDARYLFKDNVLSLIGSNSRDTLKLAVTRLTITTLEYHVLNGRAPVKSKFKRIK